MHTILQIMHVLQCGQMLSYEKWIYLRNMLDLYPPRNCIEKHATTFLSYFSVFILILFILPPLFLLIVFPTCLFKKISRCLRPRWIVSIQTFVDTFYSCYKDGTNGTRDYRAVSGYILAVCILSNSTNHNICCN